MSTPLGLQRPWAASLSSGSHRLRWAGGIGSKHG